MVRRGRGSWDTIVRATTGPGDGVPCLPGTDHTAQRVSFPLVHVVAMVAPHYVAHPSVILDRLLKGVS